MSSAISNSIDLTSSAPSPAPSNASNGPVSMKRKRDPNSILNAPAYQPAGHKSVELVSQVQFATDYLKGKRGKDISFKAIINYLSLQHSDKHVIQTFQRALQTAAAKIRYNPAGLDGLGSYKYLPVIEDVTNPDQLKAYLQKKSDSVGVKIDDIKDGWPDCSNTIENMEHKHELLVLRDRRKALKTLWQDDPTLNCPVQPDFKIAWHDIKIPPNPDELRAKLEAAGLKPTSAPRSGLRASAPKQKKPRASKRTTKVTNTHMLGKLKDFSHKRQ
jgi:transcription initiation factor TFIIE subunit beta